MTHSLARFLRNARKNALALSRQLRRNSSVARILGIETSCDDTGVAIIDTKGTVLAEALYSQSEFHAQLGGVQPPIARELHARNLSFATNDVFRESGLKLEDLDAIAVTTRPGFIMTLKEGLDHGRRLATAADLPVIPIHHMEAHALMPRLEDPSLEFPFLVLLVSGGHCLLALVKAVDEFRLLGTSKDIAPGEFLDKVARRLKVRNLESCQNLSGGPAIEKLAKDGNPALLPGTRLPNTMIGYRDCDFSFSGLRTHFESLIAAETERWSVMGGDVIPTVADVAAAVQVALAKHLAMRVERAFRYCDLKELLPTSSPRHLVLSGGVASNAFLRVALSRVCQANEAVLVCPSPRLCTDNGLMIAWNGVERWKIGHRGVIGEKAIGAIPVVAREPWGCSDREEVARAGLKVKLAEIDRYFVQLQDENLINEAPG